VRRGRPAERKVYRTVACLRTRARSPSRWRRRRRRGGVRCSVARAVGSAVNSWESHPSLRYHRCARGHGSGGPGGWRLPRRLSIPCRPQPSQRPVSAEELK